MADDDAPRQPEYPDLPLIPTAPGEMQPFGAPGHPSNPLPMAQVIVRSWSVGVNYIEELVSPKVVAVLFDVATGEEPRQTIQVNVQAEHAVALGQKLIDMGRHQQTGLQPGDPGPDLEGLV